VRIAAREGVAARAIWKGVITFGEVAVPVKLYSAAADESVHFRLVHGEDHTPVKQRMVEAESGEEVASEEVHKAFEVERGSYVLLTAEELESVKPEASRDIEVTRFVPTGSLDPQWYDRPYWLGPDGEDEAYFALAQALAQREREGIVRWVMRNHSYAGALTPVGEHLALVTLRSAAEVVPVSALHPPPAPRIDAKERKLAEQLVSALEGEFDLAEFRDEYREQVLAIVEKKRKGKKIEIPEIPRRRTEGSLEDALRKSLRTAKKEKRVA
jgi:DNA end-binding protein Ku